MGQLSSALAHEIKQPLSAILRNAEAAALFVQHPSPDLHEISAILEDIRKDDERASEVIDRMRTLLRREEVAMTSLDVGAVLSDVGTLAASRRGAAPRRASSGRPGRPAAGARRSGADPAGSAQPDPQRNRCARGRRPSWPLGHCHRPARGRGQRRNQRGRHRQGYRGESARAHLRAVLHHQAKRHGDGAVDLSQDRRKPWRPSLGRKHTGRGAIFRFTLPIGRTT